VELTQGEYNKLLNIAQNICKTSYSEDLLHECFIAMYSYPKEELESIRQKGELFFFGARIMSLMYHSKTSRYYYKIKKYNQQHIDDQDTNLDTFIFTNDNTSQKSIELIKNELDKIYWYDRELFKLYFFGDNDGSKYTYTTLAQKTGISRRSIFYTIKNVKNKIRKTINETS
tara:strand:+ start:731 stop:1246 length:516 start_codon:yes stop_codon:yes gene_type:complete